MDFITPNSNMRNLENSILNPKLLKMTLQGRHRKPVSVSSVMRNVYKFGYKIIEKFEVTSSQSVMLIRNDKDYSLKACRSSEKTIDNYSQQFSAMTKKKINQSKKW